MGAFPSGGWPEAAVPWQGERFTWTCARGCRQPHTRLGFYLLLFVTVWGFFFVYLFVFFSRAACSWKIAFNFGFYSGLRFLVEAAIAVDVGWCRGTGTWAAVGIRVW